MILLAFQKTMRKSLFPNREKRSNNQNKTNILKSLVFILIK